MLRPGRGWAELGAQVDSVSGYGVRGEVGWRVLPGLSVFGAGGVTQRERHALLGVRAEW